MNLEKNKHVIGNFKIIRLLNIGFNKHKKTVIVYLIKLAHNY
jgi:hypothetical protein